MSEPSRIARRSLTGSLRPEIAKLVGPGVEPVWQGWDLGRRPGISGDRRPRTSCRAHAFMFEQMEYFGPSLYVGISPCSSIAKVGRSANPVIRLSDGADIIRVSREHGVEKPVLVRVYPCSGWAMERQAHEFLAPDRIRGLSEWYRPGPRLRALMRRLGCHADIHRQAHIPAVGDEHVQEGALRPVARRRLHHHRRRMVTADVVEAA